MTKTLFGDATVTHKGRETKALGNWFGSNRRNAPRVGAEMQGCAHITIPFFGGGSELLYMNARQYVIADRHRHIINLASTMAHRTDGARVYRALRRFLFHPDLLDAARECCQGSPQRFSTMANMQNDSPSVIQAAAYHVCVWMGRGGKAGTKGEFKGALPVRWNDGGGSSVVRFRSAARAALAFGNIMRDRCEFSTDCGIEIVERCVHDKAKHGLYIDAPWPDAGEEYAHGFTVADQRRLAAAAQRFTETRVVIRYGDHPLIRELYPQPRWRWVEFGGRDQANQMKPEVLIINGPSYAEVCRA